MSYTEIFKFNKRGNAVEVAEVGNAWRGAMAVWTILEEKYLPPNIKYGQKMTRLMGDGAKEVWDLHKDSRLSEAEKIVMKHTFDNVIVSKENLPKLIQAFRDFEGQTSLKEQADILEGLLSDKDMIAVGWNQTSVNGDTWGNKGPESKNGNSKPYNVLRQKDHWELFSE